MNQPDPNLSANLPAPKTFAPSREDVLSTLGFFFGDPAVPEKLKDYSEHHAMCAPRRTGTSTASEYGMSSSPRHALVLAGPTTFPMVRIHHITRHVLVSCATLLG